MIPSLPTMHSTTKFRLTVYWFWKAFDKLDYNLLFDKLLGIHETLLRWLCFYEQNRTQRLSVQTFGFCAYINTSVVPQGPHLGSLLFNIFINDVKYCFRFSLCLLFVNDIKIVNITVYDDIMNKLYINIDRYCSITFTKNRNFMSYNYRTKNYLNAYHRWRTLVT